MTLNLFTIAAGAPFADALAQGVIARFDLARDPFALADTTILVPTRRAVRTLSESFARLMGGAALLPQLRPLGDVDEEALLFEAGAEDLALAPAMPPLRRRLLLATLVARWQTAKADETTGFAQAALVARALEAFLDEAETQGADLSQLEALAPAALAEHWAEVRDFLVLLREEWPKLLEAEGALDPAARRNRLIDALAARYACGAQGGPVIAAGTTGSIPATAKLLSVIAGMPQGFVVLPGLDRTLDEESWSKLDPGHPQYGLKELLARLGVARDRVRDWPGAALPSAARNRLLRETLRPAPTTDAWRAIAESDSDKAAIAEGLCGLSLIEAAHPGEEALAVALILREALQTAGRTAALVTPDRNLARRVAAELGRWAIAIDDSAGRPLAHTPPGAFLLMLAEAVAQDFAPVPLLALLKHPLAAHGEAPAAFRHKVRLLDRAVLRGPRPDPGLDGIARAIAQAPDDARKALEPWFARLAATLAPLSDAFARTEIALDALATLQAGTAEALAADAGEAGAARLWLGDAGQAAAELVAALVEAATGIPPIAPKAFPVLLRTLMEERAVRPAYGRHPRLAILGPLEARLQSYDVLVLGGLNEGSWPAAATADPWLSRPMRDKLGLASPERAIGLAAHDFATLAAAPRVYLTRAMKAEGAPTVASRWLQRLVQLTAGLGLRARLNSPTPYAGLAARLEAPAGDYQPAPRPAPTPPVALRPRSLSVTEIETWLRDPYAIYAKHVLKLLPLEPLDAPIGPLERGTAVHKVLELFLREWEETGESLAEERLVAIADHVFGQSGIPHAALALWRPRFIKAARWFAGVERERRAEIVRSHLEIRGTLAIPAPAGEFVLRARADRIDVLRTGGAAIVDYKTGAPPSPKQVRQLLAPQLPLEGAILAHGGFAQTGALTPRTLLYIQFAGGADPGKIVDIPDVAERVREAEERLAARIAVFDQVETPYFPRVMPYRAEIAGDYDHLARVREWSLSGWQEDAE